VHHSFSSWPNSHRHTTVLNAYVPNWYTMLYLLLLVIFYTENSMQQCIFRNNGFLAVCTIVQENLLLQNNWHWWFLASLPSSAEKLPKFVEIWQSSESDKHRFAVFLRHSVFFISHFFSENIFCSRYDWLFMLEKSHCCETFLNYCIIYTSNHQLGLTMLLVLVPWFFSE